MDGEWRWGGDTLKYFVDNVAIFLVHRMPRGSSIYRLQRVGVELSKTERKRLEEEGLERYTRRAK